MARTSFVYKVAKKCEKPKNTFWKFMNFWFCPVMITVGWFVYKKLKKMYLDKEIVYLPSTDAGDIIFFRQMKGYMDKHYKNKWVYIYDDRNKRIVDIMDFDCKYGMKGYWIAALSYADYFFGDNLKIHNGYGWCIFDKKYFTDSLEVQIPKYPQNEAAVEKELDTLNPNHKPMVLLAPYEQSISANGMQILPGSFWNNLAGMLIDKGYVVVTNCKGDEAEPVIAGTQRIFPKFCDLCSVSDKIGIFVSIRSGFADFTLGSTARKWILYPTDWFYDTWSVGGEHTTEIVYKEYLDNDKLQELAEEIVRGIG